MTQFEEFSERLRAQPRRWLITGVAGFIGSHLLETLLRLDQTVVGLDNFDTGSRENLLEVMSRVRPMAAARFTFLEGDIRDQRDCAAATASADFVLHQAALASVPRSMADPMSAHAVNVTGFVNVLLAAKTAGVPRIVFASSSAVYGDETAEPSREDKIGRPLSPYATTKLINEIYADTLRRTHGIESVGLRYFNVFGPRQNPRGAYASVIPRWTDQLLNGKPCEVYGDGSATRDYCYVANVVQANLLAAGAPSSAIGDGIYNVGYGERTTLIELFSAIRHRLAMVDSSLSASTLVTAPVRTGDIPHSLASIDRIRQNLGYQPDLDLARGLDETLAWYAKRARSATSAVHAKPPENVRPGVVGRVPMPAQEDW